MRSPDMRTSRLACDATRIAALALPLLAAGCSTFESGSASSGGSTLGNLIKYGSTTEPPIRQQAGDAEAADCPQVLVSTGRAAIRSGSSQVSISNVARECIERPDGSVVVKVGVEGLALQGAGGGGVARGSVPVVFQIRQGDKVVVTRTRSAPVSAAAGDSQGTFVAVEGGMVVPAKSGTFDIEVGLGGGGGRASRGR